MLAGSETTSKTMSWIFLDIARHPEVQDRLRAEIRSQRKIITARGDTEFSLTDYDAMPYLKAVVKEGLRLHPPLPTAFRMTGKDDVIPLSKPITTISGKVIHEVAVPAGTRIFTSIPAYNRYKRSLYFYFRTNIEDDTDAQGSRCLGSRRSSV